jgi:hypothetical protein
MKKTACLGLLFLMTAFTVATAQNLIGIKKDVAEDFIRKEMKGFNLDNSSKNESFNYLKFINSAGTKTLIVFFSKENISTNTRMVCDFSELDFVKEDMNNKYKKTSKTSWEYAAGIDKFVVNLEEKEWYFVVTTKKK